MVNGNSNEGIGLSTDQYPLVTGMRATNDTGNNYPRLVLPSEALASFTSSQSKLRKDISTVTPARFGFRIGDLGLLVPNGMVSELLDDADIYHLPTTPEWFRGLINLRGGLVPVFDLKMLFEMQTGTGTKQRLLVLNERMRAVGVITDAPPRSIALGQPLPQTPPLPPLLSQYSQGAYVKNQDIWVEFNFDGFFQAVGNQLLA